MAYKSANVHPTAMQQYAKHVMMLRRRQDLNTVIQNQQDLVEAPCSLSLLLLMVTEASHFGEHESGFAGSGCAPPTADAAGDVDA